jgi:RNA polymerase sigma factor (sigma-70 family)
MAQANIYQCTRQCDHKSVKDASDSELMRQVRGGRTAALATLFERHHARLYRYALRMTGNRAAAEDLVQDVFMKMLKYKATFKDDSEFVPWMFGIGRNACLAHLRRTADDRFADGDVDSAVRPEAAVEDQSHDGQDELVRRALQRLPADRREVLVLSRYEYKTYDEIAKTLECSVGAVKVRAHRAMKQLREIYLDMAGEREVPT